MSANCGSERSFGAFASPVEQPQELRKIVAAAEEAIVKMRNVFIKSVIIRNAYYAVHT